ncbi:ATP synthase protein I [Polynucleobacter sphagniphilus]|uniref:ATP synthase subunit I n=1 Tax=Polynucleobacter sphagniphilus TaxID=1743169 RepID=UPI002475C2BB|nr:ATP synthase subunit I [Polynucleobacter sphagniphilus]MDH6155716.1 ATP synthase protein I [Polynucleobacter sphagniphilus]
MIPQKNQFSKANEWDEPEEEYIRAYSKAEIIALQQNNANKYPPVSPWKVVAAQTLVTMVSMVAWAVFGGLVGVSLYTQSAFLGGLISVLPTGLFLVRLELAKKTSKLKPEGFLAALVTGEFIKIATTLMLFLGIAYLVPGIAWVPLLVTYFLALKCMWLVYLRR